MFITATKLQAFKGRGKDDYSSSPDLEDLIAVVDGRPELVHEIQNAPKDVRSYIASEVQKLLGAGAFLDALPGYLLPDSASQARITLLLERLAAIAAA